MQTVISKTTKEITWVKTHDDSSITHISFKETTIEPVFNLNSIISMYSKDEILNAMLEKGIINENDLSPRMLKSIHNKTGTNTSSAHRLKKYNYTRILLEKYRALCWATSDATQSYVEDTLFSSLEDNEFVSLNEIAQLLLYEYHEEQVFSRSKRLHNRAISVDKTRVLLQQLSNAVKSLKQFKDPTGELGQKYYSILTMMYLSKREYSWNEIKGCLKLQSNSEVKTLRRKAISLLTAVLWGCDIDEIAETVEEWHQSKL